MSELVVQYMHRVELPCDEQSTSIFKMKTYWNAFGYEIAILLGLDEDDPEEQYQDPCAVRKLISNRGVFKTPPTDQEEHYHHIMLNDLFVKLGDHESDASSGDWYFKCSCQDPDQDEIKTMILNCSS